MSDEKPKIDVDIAIIKHDIVTIKGNNVTIHDLVQENSKVLGDINVTLAENTTQLAYHIKRTDQNETMIKLIQDDIKPLIKHKLLLDGMAKAVGVLFTIIGLILAAIEIFK